MFCVKCGASLPDEANFCFKCGCDLRNLAQSSGICRSATHALRVGEYITFGRYPQNSSSYKDPIEWLVLEVKRDEALIISRYGLDCRRYHLDHHQMTWEKCDLRKWLNNDFLKEAFSEEDVLRITISELRNDDNPKYHTSGGNSTIDKVFCLSIAETEHFFKNDEERKCQPTNYARNHGACVDNSNGCCDWWWLRSPGILPYDASGVCADGAIRLSGCGVFGDYHTVRPALRIILNQ